MEKSKLYYYYWGLLSDAERRTVEEHLADPKNRAEYEMLAESFSAISSILGTDRYRKKRIPFDAVKSAYRRRKAAHYAKISGIVFAIIGVTAAIALALGYYLFPIKGQSELLTPTSDARIVFIERRIAVTDASGNVTRIADAGRPLLHDETVISDEHGSCAVAVGTATILIGTNTRMTMLHARAHGDISLRIALIRGSITLYDLGGPHRLTLTTSAQTIYAERGYRFSVRREGNEERIICEHGTIRIGK